MNARRAIARLLLPLLAGLAAIAAPLRAAHAQESAESAPIPAPVGFVNDHAAVFGESERARLEAFLDQVKRKTGAEFAVLVVRTTAPESPNAYKVRVFQNWGLGSEEKDDGLLMLVSLEERVVRFETGYGLEGALPDGLQSRIFRREMRPHFRDGDYAAGITAGVLACAARIASEAGVTLEWDGRELRYSKRPKVPGIVVAAIVFLFVAVLLTSLSAHGGGRRRRRGFGGWYGGGWGGGLGGWGGGGWSGGGGGGGFGGGFGGFGGGASGGGGGGGSW